MPTLSLLNRFVPGKATMVLDFANDADETLAAFKPYFEEASLVATSDPNLIHDIGNKLDTAGMYGLEDVDAVATAFVRKLGNNALTGAIQPVKQRYIAMTAPHNWPPRPHGGLSVRLLSVGVPNRGQGGGADRHGRMRTMLNDTARGGSDPAVAAAGAVGAAPRFARVTRLGIGVLVALGGVAAGVLAKAADESAALDWLGDLSSHPSVWILAVALIAVTARSPASASARAAIGMFAMCAGYYAFAAAALHHPVGPEAAIWTVLAVTVVPVGAALLWLARTKDRWWSALVFAAAAAVCLTDDAIARLLIALTEHPGDGFLSTLRPVRAAFDVAAAVVIVLALPRSGRIRGLAAAATVVLTLILPPLVDRVRSIIGV